MDDRFRSIEIVEMEPEHLETLTLLEQEAFPEQPWKYEGLLEELSNPLAVFRVALLDGKIAGYVGMHHIVDEGYITNVAVFPQYRRMGVGTKLIKALIKYAKANDLTMLTLEVRVSNEGAIALYEKLGFEDEGVRPDFYRDPDEDARIMTRYF